ncbi:MAG: 50S ribosomal protein L10 [Clostridia bacterium]|nr:50S ribosomal protein L10 [Clostridia bacterium]
MPSEKVLSQKKAKVEELSEKFKKAKMIVLTEYRGITVEDDTKLRAQVRANGDEYVVVKNSTISYAAKEAGIEGLEELEGPTAVVIGYEDYVNAAKVVNDFAKDHEFYTIKTGVMDGKKIEVAEVKKLASLPSKETLYSMLASALLGNIRNLAVVLDQAREKQAENA